MNTVNNGVCLIRRVLAHILSPSLMNSRVVHETKRCETRCGANHKLYGIVHGRCLRTFMHIYCDAQEQSRTNVALNELFCFHKADINLQYFSP